MVAYSNQESLTLSLKNNKAYFWSRSKKKIWLKGENIWKYFKNCLIFIQIVITIL